MSCRVKGGADLLSLEFLDLSLRAVQSLLRLFVPQLLQLHMKGRQFLFQSLGNEERFKQEHY